ncbi:hypothetical protein GPN2_23105 [Streptomyces murinus]
MFIRRSRADGLDTPGSEAGDPVRTWYGGREPVLRKTSEDSPGAIEWHAFPVLTSRAKSAWRSPSPTCSASAGPSRRRRWLRPASTRTLVFVT